MSLSFSLFRKVPEALRRRWIILTGLMCFFLLCYLGFIILKLTDLGFPVELLVGSVFMAGALFAFLVINLSANTIFSLMELHDNQKKNVEEGTAELSRMNQELQAEIQWRRGLEGRGGKTCGPYPDGYSDVRDGWPEGYSTPFSLCFLSS